MVCRELKIERVKLRRANTQSEAVTFSLKVRTNQQQTRNKELHACDPL
jgi:hypothetical protein